MSAACSGVITDHPVDRVAELLPWAVPGLIARLDQRGPP